MTLRVGVIGGTGLYDLGPAERIDVETPHGDVRLDHLSIAGRTVFFLPRHGRGHQAPPHRIPHAAHIAALAAAKCDYVIGLNNVGALVPGIFPGSWRLVQDFIDAHRSGPVTLHPDDAVHVDFSEPYCPHASRALASALPAGADAVVYVGTDGPRFETPAEVRSLAALGGHVVGMTGVREAVLAHEQGLCFAALVFVGNAAAGVGPATSARRIQAALARRKPDVLKILRKALPRLPAMRTCGCRASVAGTAMRRKGA